MIEAYRIGVRLAMTSNVAQVLGAVSHGFMGLNQHINTAQAGLARTRLALAGLAAGVAGYAMLKGVGALVHHGEELVHQQALMKLAGVENRDIAEATGAAWKVASDVIGTNVAHNLRAVRELRGILGTITDAENALPGFAKAGVVLQSVTGTDSESAIQTLAKALELRGGIVDPVSHHISPAAFENELNLALKMIIASGGMIDQRQLYNTMQMAGPMARMMNPEQFYKMMMSAIMDMGGYRAGTALQASGRALYGGIMPQRNADELARLGLLDPKKVHVKKGGNVQIDAGALTGFDVLNKEGLFVWVNTVLRKALEDHGIKGTAAQNQELFKLFPTDTMRRLMSLFLFNHEQVERDAGLFDKAEGTGAHKSLAENDPKVAMMAFNAAWDNLLTSLGSPLVLSVATMMKRAASVMDEMAQTAAKHPEAVEWIGKILLGLGAFLVAAGAVAIAGSVLGLIATGGISAMIVGVIAAFVTLAATLSEHDWRGLWEGFMSPFRAVIDFILEQIKRLSEWRPHMPTGPDVSRGMTNKPVGQGLRDWWNGTDKAQPQSYAPPAAPNRNGDVQSIVYLDGERVGEMVTKWQTRRSGVPMQGVGSFDGRRGFATVDI